MAEGARTEGLEALLEREVVRRLSGAPVGEVTRGRLRDVVRTVLRADQLMPEEAALAGSGELTGAALDEALGLRIRRAMVEALAVLREQGHAVPDVPPAAQVLRAASQQEAISRGQTLDASLSVDALAQHTDSLVLTDRTTFGWLVEVLDEVTFRPGDEATPTDSPTGVEVLEAEDALTDLSETLRVARKPSGPTADADALVGQVLGGKYRVVRLLGRGGFGSVYEAVDAILGATVAVKVLNEKAARSPTALEEFLAEARRITSLDHENIVRWITFDTTPEGLHYFVMEYLAGEELDKVLLREQRLPPDRVARILLQTLAALCKAHHREDGESLLHLDLKPQNLFIQPGSPEKVKVIDFGIGQHVGAEAIAADQERVQSGELGPDDLEASLATVRSSVSADRARSPGSRVKRARGGTVLYSSPEQCAHLSGAVDIVALDGRSDLYSLGVMAFKMLTGHYPWKDWGTLNQAFKNHVEIPPRKVTDFGVKVPRKLAAFIECCLEKDRKDRWKDTQEAYDAMHAIVHPPAWPKLVAVLVPLLLLVGSAAWFFRPEATGGAIELRVAGAGSTRSVASEPIYLGAERPSVELQVGKLADKLRGGTARLLRYPDGAGVEAQGVPQDGWDLAWVADGRLRLALPGLVSPERNDASGPAAFEGLGGEVAVRVEGDGLVQESSRFRLVVMAPGSWELTALDVEGGRGARAVEPTSLDLEIGVDARLADVASVELDHPGAGSPLEVALRSGREQQGGQLVYRVPLESLELPNGHVALTARVTDRAGGTQTRTTELDVVTGALSLEGAPVLDGCKKLGGRWIVTPNSIPVLSVALSRPAALSWEMRDDVNGTVIDSGNQPPAALHELVLSREAFAEAGRGTLGLLFDESSLVLHEGGVLERDLPFTYLDVQPDFALYLGGTPLTGDRFLTSADTVLQVSPKGERVPTQLDVTLVREADGQQIVVPTQRLGLEDRNAQLTVSLPDDGAYTLEVGGAPLDAASGELLGAPTVEGPFRLVLDRAAPALIWRTEEDLFLRDRAERGEVLLEVRGEEAVDDAATMSVDYRLVAPDAPAGDWASGVAQRSGDVLRFELPAVDSLGGDGVYRLDLRVLDGAGNESKEVSRRVVIATQGPQLSISRPARFYVWEADAGTGVWSVAVRAHDPNGTMGMTADVVSVDDPALRADVPLRRSDARAEIHAAVETEWSGDVVLDHRWSGSRVELVLAAEDGEGVEAEITAGPFQLPSISRERPPRLAVTLPGRPVVPMRLLSATGRDDFLFHGRPDETENEDYRHWGLPPFNTKDLPRAWKVRIASDALPEIYLDEHEVTEAEYLSFVQASDGWVDASHWPGEPGTAERRAALETRLSVEGAAASDLPVTAVTWDEAAAFAHWAGKRLPTLVEWEVAVRGGGPGDYRPYASHGTHEGMPSPAVVNYDPQQSGANGGPWPAALGEDVCAKTGLRNLCSNVAEWTASPASFVEPGGRSPGNLGRHFTEHLEQLLAPQSWSGWSDASEYWVAGGSFRRPSVDFSFVSTERRGRLRSDVGFRCALDVPRVFAVMERESPGTVERLDP